MLKPMLFLHLLAAIFTVGPLAHAVTTAARGLRRGDADAARESARMTNIYSLASVAAVIFGFGLMSQKSPRTGEVLATFSDTYIWLSTLLWVVAVGIAHGVVIPSLRKAADAIDAGGDAAALRGRVAAAGGAIGLILAVIVALMAWKP